MKRLEINIDRIPENRMWKNKNGERKVTIIVTTRREPDQFGNTELVYLSQSQEERSNKEPKIYIGGGKSYENFNNN